jgi:hypothetical protein
MLDMDMAEAICRDRMERRNEESIGWRGKKNKRWNGSAPIQVED